jgi:hypothetical protein
MNFYLMGRCLSATCSMRGAHQAYGLGPMDCDQERFKNEREFGRAHSFPLLTCSRSLRVRRLWADPLAHLPLSLSCGRRTRLRFDCRYCTDGATACRRSCLPPHRPPASRRARVPFLCRVAAGEADRLRFFDGLRRLWCCCHHSRLAQCYGSANIAKRQRDSGAFGFG